MDINISNALKIMLSSNFFNGENLLYQFLETSLKTEKEGMHYVITPVKKDVDAISRKIIQLIRMDTYPESNTMFAFELKIVNEKFDSLTISKHNDKEEELFDIEEISLEKPLLSYDISLFKDKKHLPIGTVVSLQKGIRKMMIYGRLVKNASDNKTYDYIGCFYPEGIRNVDHAYLFDTSQIMKVHWLGLEGIEEDKLLEMME